MADSICLNNFNYRRRQSDVYSIGTLDHESIVNTRYYKNPLHLDVVYRYLWRVEDNTIPDEAPTRIQN